MSNGNKTYANDETRPDQTDNGPKYEQDFTMTMWTAVKSLG